ncbi:sodium:solute symporter family protein [Candidatus Peregrinibacteria bacterium]|nr:sodium:solute symporter family protein [Candidatus Peregrinibacteria bacterium]
MQISILFFLLYIAAVAVIGWFASRKETEEGFMIADRKVAGLQLAATMSAGFFDGATLSIYLAYIYRFGFSAIWLFIGLGLGLFALRRFATRIKQKADELRVYTMPEYFFRTIGSRSGLAYSVVLIIAFFCFLVVNLIVSGQVLSTIFPLPYALSVAIGGGVIMMYLLLAGFKAVVRTDVFQFLIMIFMTVSVAAYFFGKTTIPTTDLQLVGRMDAGTLIGFLVIGVFAIMVQPDLWQRIFAARDVTTMKRGLMYGGFILPLLALILSVIGLVTKQLLPDIVPENALVAGFSSLLPIGFKELGMVLLYAVTLSSSDTLAFVVSSIFTRDLQHRTRRFSETSMRQMTRFFIALFIAIAVIIGIIYQDIITLGLSLASLSLALFPPTFASLFWKLSDRAVAWSVGLAALSVVPQLVTSTLTPETSVIPLPVSLVALLISQGFVSWKRRRGTAQIA